MRLPVIFHQRDAFDEFIAILRDEWAPQMRGVVHCFTGTPEQALTCVKEFGLLLGIGGVVTFANAHALRDAVRAVGLRSIVLETDCPYLAPVPMRGKRNEPAFIAYTAAKVSELVNVPLEDVIAQTDDNCGGSLASELLRAGPHAFDSIVERADDRWIARAESPVRQIGGPGRDGRVGGADPRAIRGDGELLRILADAHAHAGAHEVVEGSPLGRIAAQVDFGDE